MTSELRSGEAATLVDHAVARQRLNRRLRLDRLLGQGLVMPALTLVAATQIVPAVYALLTSLRDVQFFRDRGYVGLGNYREILTDPSFWDALKLSVIFTLAGVALGLAVALASAYAIHHMGRRGTILATMLLVPWAMSPIIVAILFRWILAPFSGGLFVWFLESVGLPSVALLSTVSTALPTLVVVTVWRNFAYAAIVLAAGFAQIPKDLPLAAAVDGASRWEQFRKVLLPLLLPSVRIAMVLLTISYFNEVQIIIGLTNGGPLRATSTLSYYLYDVGIIQLEQGIGNAVTVAMFIINSALIVFFVLMSKRIERKGRRPEVVLV